MLRDCAAVRRRGTFDLDLQGIWIGPGCSGLGSPHSLTGPEANCLQSWCLVISLSCYLKLRTRRQMYDSGGVAHCMPDVRTFDKAVPQFSSARNDGRRISK